MPIDRRDFLRTAAVLAGGSLSVGCTNALLQLDPDAPRVPGERLFDGLGRARLVAAVDRILPATDTPGAVAAGAPDFVEMMLVDYYYEPERKVVVDGLEDLDRRSRAKGGVAFVDTSHAFQDEILTELEREGMAAMQASGVAFFASLFGGGPPPPAFFQALGELVVVGFCTSEVAAQHEFLFAPMHGDFEGCVPFETVGRPYIL